MKITKPMQRKIVFISVTADVTEEQALEALVKFEGVVADAMMFCVALKQQ